MQLLLISWPAKRRSSHSIVMLAVWGVASSCCNHCSSRCTPQGAQSVPRTCWEPRCNALCKPSLSLQHHSPTKTVRLCHVSIWQPTQCPLQSAVVSEGLPVVLEIPRTQSSCYWHGLMERSGLHHWTTHSEGLQSCFRTTGTSQHVLPCHFVWEFGWSGFCMGTIEGHSSRFCEWMNEKDPTLESVSGVTFLDSVQQNLSLRRHLQSTFYHLLISVLFW